MLTDQHQRKLTATTEAYVPSPLPMLFPGAFLLCLALSYQDD